MPVDSVGSPALWIGFTLFVVTLLVLDVGVFHRKAHAIGYKEALAWCAFWVSLALGFNVLVYHWFGPERALEFTTGYLIEEALSVDNMFVFLIIFTYFKVAPALQHRVLFWGILGALVMRAIFILAGRGPDREVPLDHLPLWRLPAVHRRAAGEGQGRRDPPRA
jgi:tellurite resistance protein TerC